MARAKKDVKDGNITEETETTETEAIPMVTNVTLSVPVNIDTLPGPEVKLETVKTVAEKAESIELGDKAEIIDIRGFEGTAGKVIEIRSDGYIVIKAANGVFAAPKAKVKKV